MHKRRKRGENNRKSLLPHILVSRVVIYVAIFCLAIWIGYYFNLLYSNPGVAQNEAGVQKDAIQSARKISELCTTSNNKNECYPKAFYNLTKETTLKHTVETLQEIHKINPQDTRGCHFIAHLISQAETEKDPEKWQEVVKNTNPQMCTGGFLHGALEVHQVYDRSFEINRQSATDICDGLFEIGSFARRSCYHSLGHLLLVEKAADTQAAIDICEDLELYMPQFECLSGAFMEHITAENLVAHGLQEKTRGWDEAFADDYEEFCRGFSALPARACWKELSYLYFSAASHDPRGLYERCQRAPDQVARDTCFIYGAGNLVTTTRFKRENLHMVCHQLGENHPLFDRCIEQIIGSLLTSTFETLPITLSICEGTYTLYKPVCYQKIEKILRRRSADKLVYKRFCELLPADLACRSTKTND